MVSIKTSGTTSDPCETCGTSNSELKYFPFTERVAHQYGTNIYSNYTICPVCESIYYSYTGDETSEGHPIRYRLEKKKQIELLQKVPYKAWMRVKNPKTEYGMYRKLGKQKLYNPYKGEVYSVIEAAFQYKRMEDIEKLKTIYPKEVEMVQTFDV